MIHRANTRTNVRQRDTRTNVRHHWIGHPTSVHSAGERLQAGGPRRWKMGAASLESQATLARNHPTKPKLCILFHQDVAVASFLVGYFVWAYMGPANERHAQTNLRTPFLQTWERASQAGRWSQQKENCISHCEQSVMSQWDIGASAQAPPQSPQCIRESNTQSADVQTPL